jgi:hypothetical protein
LPESGNVGIGTTSPSAKLDVKGKVIIDSTLVVKDSVVFEKDTRIKQKLVVDQKVVMKDDAVVRQDFRVQGKSRFDSLVVMHEKVRMTNIADAPNMNNRKVLVVNQNGLIMKYDFSELLQDFYPYPYECLASSVTNAYWTGAPNKVFINCPDVRAGIGTDNPEQQLHVINNGLFGGYVEMSSGIMKHETVIGSNEISSFSKLLIKNTNRPAGLEIDQSANQNQWSKLLMLRFSNPTTEIIKVENTFNGNIPFLLEANGRMIIRNNENKIFQLNPDGLIQTREVKVNLENWPDYVFDKDYPLMPLEEVSTFIQENGHLPNVPTAETIENEGLSLGEMNKILMEKIEELTLHLIQQEKRIQELEKNAK